jgi:hypothetical protein
MQLCSLCPGTMLSSTYGPCLSARVDSASASKPVVVVTLSLLVLPPSSPPAAPFASLPVRSPVGTAPEPDAGAGSAARAAPEAPQAFNRLCRQPRLARGCGGTAGRLRARTALGGASVRPLVHRCGVGPARRALPRLGGGGGSVLARRMLRRFGGGGGAVGCRGGGRRIGAAHAGCRGRLLQRRPVLQEGGGESAAVADVKPAGASTAASAQHTRLHTLLLFTLLPDVLSSL